MGATMVVQPMDLLKNRMQVLGKGASLTQVTKSIIRTEGVMALYTGLSAGLFRQATYTTTRLGVYNSLSENMASADGKPLPFWKKAFMGVTAGACGAFVGTPSEVALIRMSVDGSLPAESRRGYKNVFNALARITKEEGIFALWRGVMPTVGRAMVVNAAQLASYDQAKQFFTSTVGFRDGIGLHFCASMVSGLVTTLASMPVDIAKTRIQNMRTVNGKPEYSGALDVIQKVIRNEGVFSLWKGFLPYYSRLGPHTVLTFILLEQLRGVYKAMS